VTIDEYGRVQWHSGEWLSGNFRGGDFRGGDFRGGNFWGGNFLGGDFWGGYFRGGNFRGGDFRGGNFWGGNFRGGNFLGGDFRGGDFWGGDFRGGAIKIKPQTLYGLHWRIIIVDDRMEIGCQRHTHAEWKKFTDAEISAMDSYALEFWKENKSFLLAACAAHAKRAKRVAKERAAPTTDNRRE
jgi:uncharacterized protein YjbI with pentapeptide repeats